MARHESGGLVRELNLGQAASIVVGIVIGSGIFLGVNRVAQGVDNVALLFGVWIGAGLITLLGALTYAEFGALYPRSGGDYVYAREALGPFWGFFNGWATFAINYPASLAALAVAWAGQLDQLKPETHLFLFVEGFAEKFTGIALLAIFAVVNYLGVRQAGWTQLGVTMGKVALVLVLVVVGLASDRADPANVGDASAPTKTFAVALVGALWAYDGWTGITKVAGEVKEPQRNLPRSLAAGILGVLAIYLLLSLAYVLVLGLDGFRGTGLSDDDARAVASRAGDALFGAAGETFVIVLILVSILSPINGLTLAGPRVYYAMARDGLFPAAMARVHALHRVPHVSILVQSGLSAVLVVFFTFEQLTAYVVLASWTAYALTGFALIRLRMTRPDLERPYRVPGYPVVPVLFLMLSTGFIGYLFYASLQVEGRLLGMPTDFTYLVGNVVVLALAVPAYWFFVGRPRAHASHD